MKKITRVIAAASAVALATASVPAAAFAAPADAAQVEFAAATQPREAKTWYVKVLEGSANGTGSETDPFNDFAKAYRAASDGDTIVLMNTATILDGDDGRMDGFFAMGKSLAIAGHDGEGGLSCRPALVLGADVTFNGIEFFATSVSLNGHGLSMNNVKNYTQNTSRPTVYGGKANGITENPSRAGQKSVLTVEAPAGTTMEFQGIYAGSQTGDYVGDVEINLTSGAKAIDRLSADGAAGKVTGSVNVNLGATKVVVEKIENQRQAGVADGASLNLDGFSPSSPVSISGFDKVNIKGSNLKVSPAAFANNGAVAIDQTSTFDATSAPSPVRVESFDSQQGALVKLHGEGVLEVAGALTGTFEMRTNGFDSQTSGLVQNGHAYVKAGDATNGNVTFKPYTTQSNFKLVKQQVGQTTQWIARSGIDKPLASLEIAGENRIEVKLGDVERTMTFADANSAPLTYTPNLFIEVKGPDGSLFDRDILNVVQDDNDPALLRFEILNESMEAGTYTLVFTDITSGAVIEKPFDFFKNTDPNPNPGPGGGDGGNGGGGTGGGGGGTVDPEPEPGPEPEPEPTPQPGTPDAPITPPAIDDSEHENVCPGVSFGDVVSTQWYHDAVDYVTWNKIMTGISETSFEPESTTTRAMTAMVLWRMAGSPEPQNAQAFSDIDPNAWYAKPIAWAAENGIAHGYGDTGVFGPEDEVTREQFATFLMRFAAYKDFDTSSRADLSAYGDAADIDAFAQDALSWGVAQGLFKGIGDTMTLAPQNDSTRAQMAMLLMRFCQSFLEK